MNITRLNTLNDDKVIIKKEGSNVGNSGDNSGGGSGSDWHYFDVSGCDNLTKYNIMMMGLIHKVQGEKINSAFGSDVIMPTGLNFAISIDIAEITAVATDYAVEIYMMGQGMTLGEGITTAKWYGTIPEITKEEFYNLNT